MTLLWRFIQRTSAQVAKWPSWKYSGPDAYGSSRTADRFHTVIGTDQHGPVRLVIQGARDAANAEIHARIKHPTIAVARVVEGRDIPQPEEPRS